MYVLDEALKKMRKVEVRQNPEEYNKTLHLWRGMKDKDLDLDKCKRMGGTELALMTLMSTTASRPVAEAFAAGDKGGILFHSLWKGHSKGVSIAFLSLYPKEEEYLYPPLTHLTFDENSQDEDPSSRIKVINVEPQNLKN